MKKDFIRAFTLAETMIVLVVLGVIAVVTVPALVNKHIESTNRTKIKKAMSVYDTALNKMVIENGIKDNAALYESANSFAPENDCTNTAPYFKVSTVLNNNICTFKAPDGLFWDISKINAPILAFNEADLNNEDAQNRYQLVGHFDNNGSLRVDDLAFETGDNKTALQKTYNFINAVKEEECTSKLCIAEKIKTNTCENPINNSGTYYNCSNCKSCNYRGLVYDENGTPIYITDFDGGFPVIGVNGNVVAINYECSDENGDNCEYCSSWYDEGCANSNAKTKY